MRSWKIKKRFIKKSAVPTIYSAGCSLKMKTINVYVFKSTIKTHFKKHAVVLYCFKKNALLYEEMYMFKKCINK